MTAAFITCASCSGTRDGPTHGLRKAVSLSFSKIIARLDDAMLLVLVVLLFPVIILLVGAPVALMVRALIEIAHRF